MKIFNWNSDPDKEVERELGAEFLRAVKIFYSDEENRKEFEEYVRREKDKQAVCASEG